jgi:protoporphyrin/coproporphyrin ferrochelatase
LKETEFLFDSTPKGYAVMLTAYGAPSSLSEVEPYLRDVRGGRATPRELVDELVLRYRAIGGCSPLLDRTREQAAGLERALGGPVFVGMRHWRPYIADVLGEIQMIGFRCLVVAPLAPHFSRMSVGAYQESVARAQGSLDVAFVEPWHEHPLFIAALEERIRAGLERFPGSERDRVSLVFTAHSLPQRILREGDPYVERLQASVAAVSRKLQRPGRLAFQSAGRTGEPWLAPSLAESLDELAAGGARQVLLCPIGFVSDHLEVLYDIDVEAQAQASALGLRLVRTESLNSSGLLIGALAEVVNRAAEARGWTRP